LSFAGISLALAELLIRSRSKSCHFAEGEKIRGSREAPYNSYRSQRLQRQLETAMRGESIAIATTAKVKSGKYIGRSRVGLEGENGLC